MSITRRGFMAGLAGLIAAPGALLAKVRPWKHSATEWNYEPPPHDPGKLPHGVEFWLSPQDRPDRRMAPRTPTALKALSSELTANGAG